MRGTFDGMFVLARAVTAAEVAPFIGYYTVGLPVNVLEVGSEEIDNRPEGYGYVTVTVSRSGKAKYSGLLADGTRLSGSATLMVFTGVEMSDMGYSVEDDALYAAFPIFKTLYRNSGSVAALVWIAGNALDHAGDNTVWLDDSMWHYPGQSTRLTDDAFLAVLGVDKAGTAAHLSETAIMAGAFYAKRQDLMPLFEGGQFWAAEEFVPLVVSSSSLKLDRDNVLGAKLKASASTGLFSGSIKQENQSTGRMQTLKYKGALLVGEDGSSSGYGAYQQQEKIGSYRVKRSRPVVIIDAVDR
ncbi:MAG: hypothetical protein PHU80_11750 [Kiritimatiellae bacterium]|nr:hypothetical protein [Kiritimatiellia bacterium]